MPTTVALGTHFEDFVKTQLASGRYNNVSEIIRAGLSLLEDQAEIRRLKLERLKADLQAGVDSGPSTPLDMAEVRAEGKRLRAQRLAQGPA